MSLQFVYEILLNSSGRHSREHTLIRYNLTIQQTSIFPVLLSVKDTVPCANLVAQQQHFALRPRNKDLATELNANTLGQQRSEYMKGMALHWEEGITSSTAHWLTDGNSYQLFRNRHQQKHEILLAFRVEKQVKPSLRRRTSLAVLLQYRNGKSSSKGPLPGPYTDALQYGQPSHVYSYCHRNVQLWVEQQRRHSRHVPRSSANLGFDSHHAP